MEGGLGVAVEFGWEVTLWWEVLGLFARSSMHSACAVAHADAAHKRAQDEARNPSWVNPVQHDGRKVCEYVGAFSWRLSLHTRSCLSRESG